ncbi:hypothetical protein HX001_13175 [Empedobacter brevis]|uniref:DUF5640 domain-containing protein n=2 Tax=Empedobacter brevis TaxID=247 RepID=A0A511NEX1_9FLAO|nr:hypothetical protein [Empedobacter brevis]MDM1073436.1 hypothetical protein [Empedobacter brevis]QES92445.1 hypothetical protein F0358_06810 [Empedobacter brevis]QHC84200.1 hypothetical protein AS589_05050 [Empedobacter brevis]GEM51157.1 hypothetical protein EB1_09470 [Empedobacter brevis NBRC 14943 = ATCC 43319]
MRKTENQQIEHFIKSAEIDERFVGIWSGTDHGKFFKGETNSWLVHRKADGTMTVNFKTIHSDDRVTFSEDEGIWCAVGEDYYEFRESDEKADHYTYLFLSKDSIHFIINEELKEEEPYNFIDNRVFLD